MLHYAAYCFIGNFIRGNDCNVDKNEIKKKFLALKSDKAFQKYVFNNKGKDIIHDIETGSLEMKLGSIREKMHISTKPKYLDPEDKYYRDIIIYGTRSSGTEIVGESPYTKTCSRYC